MEIEKSNIFKDMFLSIANINFYNNLRKNKILRILGHIFLLSLICVLISILIPFFKFQMELGGIKEFMSNEVPYFEFENAKFYIDEPFVYDNYETFIYIDIDKDFYLDDLSDLKDYVNVILIDQDKLLMKNNGKIQQLDFYMYDGVNFTKDDAIDFVATWFYILVVIVFFIMTIFQPVGILVGTLILSIIGLIINASIKSNISFGEIFKISLYARTLPIFIKLIFGLFSVHFSFFIGLVISVVYVFFALKKIKSNMESQYSTYTM